MTARIHRGLTSVLAALAAVTTLLGETDPGRLKVDGTVWSWVGISLAIAIIVVTAGRQFFESN